MIAFNYIETTIPAGMTISEYRRRRPERGHGLRDAPRRRARRAACALAAASVLILALLVLPGSASAATTCSYSDKNLEVLLPAANDRATVSVALGEIRVDANGGKLSCGSDTPTVTNTNAIAVRATAASNEVRIERPGDFAPGASNEDGDDEIEFFVSLGNGSGSSLTVGGEDPAGQSIRLGSDGINPNAVADERVPDYDIFALNVPRLVVVGGSGRDVLGAQGEAGTGGPLTTGVVMDGRGGGDILTGGEGDDLLGGAEGGDVLAGLGGNDDLRPGQDDDSIDGGPGAQDEVGYGGFNDVTAGVTVDLARTGPQSTGGAGTDWFTGVESVTGSGFADVLRGDGEANELRGELGADVIEGRGGADKLFGSTGEDRIEARDGGPDTADCGPDADSATADGRGIDSLLGCETVAFAAGGGPGGGPAADRQAPVIGSLRLAPRRFRVARRGTARSTVRRGTRIGYRLSEPAKVTLGFQRRRGRRWVTVGSLRRSGRAGSNRVAFSGRIGRRALRRGAHRLVIRAVDPAGNPATPRTTRFRVVR